MLPILETYLNILTQFRVFLLRATKVGIVNCQWRHFVVVELLKITETRIASLYVCSFEKEKEIVRKRDTGHDYIREFAVIVFNNSNLLCKALHTVLTASAMQSAANTDSSSNTERCKHWQLRQCRALQTLKTKTQLT